MKKKIRVVLLFSILISLSCNGVGQVFNYQPVGNYYERFVKPKIDFVEIVRYLPPNYVSDGSVDYTDYIQKAINENKNVAFPNFPVRINDNGITLRSNSNVFFDRKSQLLLAPTSKAAYKVLFINKVSDVKIYNPTIIGDRKQHLGIDGEHGMGIRIHDSKSIKIYNPTIKDTWGDGIYITSYPPNYSKDITIKYGIIDNARRNGISIISGRDITIDSLQISNTNGHNPAAGIDIEPNNKSNELKNIFINNLFTYNNERDGVIISLSRLVDSKKRNKVIIKILNHKDVGSRLGLGFSGLRHASPSDKSLKGQIEIKNALYIDSRLKKSIRVSDNYKQLPKISLQNIQSNNFSNDEFEQHIRKMIDGKKQFKYKD